MAERERSGETTSGSLLLRVRNASDTAAWLEFENRYSELIRRYCARRGIKSADIDDISQLVWVDLARRLRGFEYDAAKGRFRGYLGRVVQNAISRHFARDKRNVLALDDVVHTAIADDSDDVDKAWDQEWVDHHYRLAMQTIERTFEETSVALFKRLLAGATVAQVAADLGMTVAAVTQAKHRIRVRMKDLIAWQIREEDEPELPTML
jgi:RNA polymerase sigma-70 factor (ECF subfamily)